jgi:drug/metabolite transporter (DMT)-like permease
MTSAVHAPAPAESPAVAIFLVAASIVAFAVSDAIVKALAGAYEAPQIILIRSIVALPLIAALLSRAHTWGRMRGVQQGWLSVRVVFGTLSYITFILALEAIPLAETVALTFAGPLFITALSVPLLGERVGPRRWAAVVVGLVGVIIIVQPGGAVFQPEALWALASAACYAVAAMGTRKLALRTPTSVILAWVNGYVLILMAAAVVFFELWVTPDLIDLLLLCAIGLASTVGQYLGVEAYRRAQPSLLAPFDYTALIWATAFGFFIWGEVPTYMVIAGSGVLVASGLYILHRETVRSSHAVTGWRGLRRWR